VSWNVELAVLVSMAGNDSQQTSPAIPVTVFVHHIRQHHDKLLMPSVMMAGHDIMSSDCHTVLDCPSQAASQYHMWICWVHNIMLDICNTHTDNNASVQRGAVPEGPI